MWAFFCMCWFVSMLSLDIKHEIHFYFLKFDSAKRHFPDFTRGNKLKILKGFLHFFWWKSFACKIDSTLILKWISHSSLKLFLWNPDMEKVTSASSYGHKSTYFVKFVFIHFNQFLLKGNTYNFTIHSFRKFKI